MTNSELLEISAARDRVRVLIVDDHRDFAENLAELGRMNSLAPVICGSCDEARRLIVEELFDVAIVDQHLPDGLGLDLLTDLRARSPDVVTIVVTAFVSLDDTLAALNHGAFAFLAKDSDPDELLAIIARAAENAKLRRENRGLRDLREAILHALPDLVLLVDASTRIVSVNRRHPVFCPGPPAAAAGLPVREAVAPFLRDQFDVGEWLREAQARGGETERTVEVRDDAGRLWILGLRTLPLSTDASTLLLVRVADLTDRIALERQLNDAQHLATLGRLVSSIAHELRNPLAGIRALSQILQRRLAGAPEDRENASEILALTDRMHATLSDLLEFARPGGRREETIDVAELVEGVHREALRWPSAERRRLEYRRIGGRPLQRVAARDRISGAIENLVQNALHAAPPDGRVRLTLADTERGCEVIVEDDGPGVPADVLPRLFQPFFTTKTRGTGLGLSIVKSTVQSLGGTIDVGRSDDLGGARFRLRLPLPSA
jgi:signal transduction histidine kinase